MSATIPSDTHVSGDTGHTTDHDNIADCLITMSGTASGGTVTAQATMNNLAGATTSGQYLRGNGANVVMSAVQRADLPDSTPWIPADNGLLGANFNLPAINALTPALTNGTLYLAKLSPRMTQTIGTIWLAVNQNGTGTSTGTFMGLYSSSGTLLTGSSDLATQWAAFGPSFPLTSAQSVTGGTFVWAAILVNLATQQPNMWGGYGDAGRSFIANQGLTASQYMFAINGTGLTSLPASITPSSNVNGTSAYSFWLGWS